MISYCLPAGCACICAILELCIPNVGYSKDELVIAEWKSAALDRPAAQFELSGTIVFPKDSIAPSKPMDLTVFDAKTHWAIDRAARCIRAEIAGGIWNDTTIAFDTYIRTITFNGDSIVERHPLEGNAYRRYTIVPNTPEYIRMPYNRRGMRKLLSARFFPLMFCYDLNYTIKGEPSNFFRGADLGGDWIHATSSSGDAVLRMTNESEQFVFFIDSNSPQCLKRFEMSYNGRLLYTCDIEWEKRGHVFYPASWRSSIYNGAMEPQYVYFLKVTSITEIDSGTPSIFSTEVPIGGRVKEAGSGIHLIVAEEGRELPYDPKSRVAAMRESGDGALLNSYLPVILVGACACAAFCLSFVVYFGRRKCSENA